jgi:hypothetical protein
MTHNQNKLYQFNVSNLREINKALVQIARLARDAIASKNSQNTRTFLIFYLLLLGAWAECQLEKLISAPGAFTDSEKKNLHDERNHLLRWLYVVKLAFSKHFHVPVGKLDDITLTHDDFHRYETITQLLTRELKPIIELRNKLAHGQWFYPLNETRDNVSTELKKSLEKENLLSLQFKKSLISSILDMVTDLAISLKTYKRDFNQHYKRLKETQRNLQSRDYVIYETSLRAKLSRGLEKKYNRNVKQSSPCAE